MFGKRVACAQAGVGHHFTDGLAQHHHYAQQRQHQHQPGHACHGTAHKNHEYRKQWVQAQAAPDGHRHKHEVVQQAHCYKKADRAVGYARIGRVIGSRHQNYQ